LNIARIDGFRMRGALRHASPVLADFAPSRILQRGVAFLFAPKQITGQLVSFRP
jgi:hypothetical protein